MPNRKFVTTKIFNDLISMDILWIVEISPKFIPPKILSPKFMAPKLMVNNVLLGGGGGICLRSIFCYRSCRRHRGSTPLCLSACRCGPMVADTLNMIMPNGCRSYTKNVCKNVCFGDLCTKVCAPTRVEECNDLSNGWEQIDMMDGIWIMMKLRRIFVSIVRRIAKILISRNFGTCGIQKYQA